MNFNELFNYLKNKYPEPKIRGKNFEPYAKWFLENDSVYKKTFKKVWLWDDWPGKWGPDDGIDLIAEDYEGRIWSIQSKNYAENNIIKNGIDSFGFQSSHKDIYGMYLLTTSDNISPNSLRQMHNSEKDFLIIGVSELSRIVWPKEEDLNKKINIVKATPEPHQELAIKKVSEGFKKEDRGKLIMACGTGKTLTGLWIKEKIKSKKTIVFFPSLGLLSDTLAEYCKHGEDKFNFLCVCSDISVTKGADDYLDKTDSLSFPTTTQTDEIVEFLNREEDSIIFSTYQSSPKIEEATKKIKDFSFDLAIFDEAHRSTGKEDKTFTKALNDKNIKCKKRLFMTATPKFASKIAVSKAKEFDQEIISMDDENLYGKNFYELKFSQAIKENLLSDYRVVICGVLDSEIKKMIDKRTFVQLEEMTGDSETFANYISLAKTLKKYEIKSLITYHSSVKRAKELKDNFIKIVNESNIKLEDSLFTDHINGTYPANERRKILDRLRNLDQDTAGIVTNARCLTEGIDVPSLDGIAFVDPRQSQVDVIQAVGRAIRKVRGSNKEKVGTIVIPIFITNEEEIDEVADKSAYKKIWQIVNALKDHDDFLKVEIENLRFEMGKRTLSPKPRISKIIYDIEAKIGSNF
ncbi:MAG: DEAD/DEAH box helicase family protein, partial [Thermodesulfobacteriota bacterium]